VSLKLLVHSINLPRCYFSASCFSDSSALPGNAHGARNALKKYKAFVKNRNYDEAKAMATKITVFIKRHIDATPYDVRSFGIKLRQEKLLLESMAIFESALNMSQNISKPEEKFQMIEKCVEQMKETIHAMYLDDMEDIVRLYLPAMRLLMRQINTTSQLNDVAKCYLVSRVLYYIGWSERWARQLGEREQTLEVAISSMDDVFGKHADRYWVYGELLRDLGYVRYYSSSYEEAASLFQRSIDALKAAKDVEDFDEWKRWIGWSQDALWNAQLALNRTRG